ncbi:hypothetical protein [Streptomyces sp. 7N604]|uniref:hypothetical protein n=1 Tax=Streptomyces sp. 7N604 TaxID=3457415 RepID=UPI003FD47D79
MTTAHASSRATTAIPAQATFGAAGGLVGGVAFGIMMQVWDMMPMVAMVVDSTSTGVAWLVHLAISAFIGITFALLAGHRPAKMLPATALGLVYGAVWECRFRRTATDQRGSTRSLWRQRAICAVPASLGRKGG